MVISLVSTDAISKTAGTEKQKHHQIVSEKCILLSSR